MKTRYAFSQLTFALLAVIGLAFSGCNLNFSMFDGYTFTKTGQTAQWTEEGKFSEGINAIDVVNRFGDVKVELAVGEPGWKWDSKVWADSQELADLLIDELAMDVQTKGKTQTWRVVLPEPTSDLNGVESNLTLMLPADVEVNLVNAHGNVAAAKIYADVKLANGHGNVDLKELSGTVHVKNSHGDLVANDIGEATIDVSHGDTDIVSANGEISIFSSHGDISATNLMGDVKAENSHGLIRIGTSGENVSAKSTHGRIDLSMMSSNFYSIDIETSHASIKVELPSSANPDIDMQATHGETKSEFESAVGSQQKVNLRATHGDIRVTTHEAAVDAVH